ncbi:hypothetical protein SAMN02745126_01004 [Enhydrobacter aerosaccus]|uniref:Glycosyl transferase family 2 n=1 Tax=Enhydrobacter aerosaccus TaxID=225324 RepID=A0A1T4KJ72_9HYPH|nr:hypothetical protein [Enhydrobacter aerosaccus]SJZ42441.1 hypothetical protein SAMN02745126_01004 [Enhydrobacter aerosaccus]
MNAQPYVSFVTWGRNDGYTPGYVERVSRATTTLARQLDDASVPSEIVLVEWNPAPDRPLLLDVLDIPNRSRHVAVRGIIVDPKYHYRLAGAHERGLNGGEASNVGIRRARGRFITPKASDTVFSPEVIERIARQDLDPDTMYRIDRHDIADDAVWQLEGPELLTGLGSAPSTPQSCLQQSPLWQIRDLHTNACGDFTLMAASYWHRLRGHARDRTVLALDVDSLAMHAAAALGARECRWPAACRVYKPVHGNLNNARVTQVWRPWQRRLEAYLLRKFSSEAAHQARMLLDYPRRRVRGVNSVLGPSIERNFVWPATRWARGEKPTPSQPEDWGLAAEKLETRSLCRAAWEEIAAAEPVPAG